MNCSRPMWKQWNKLISTVTYAVSIPSIYSCSTHDYLNWDLILLEFESRRQINGKSHTHKKSAIVISDVTDVCPEYSQAYRAIVNRIPINASIINIYRKRIETIKRKLRSESEELEEEKKTIEKSKCEIENADELRWNLVFFFLAPPQHHQWGLAQPRLESWIDFKHIFKLSITSELVSSSPSSHVCFLFFTFLSVLLMLLYDWN